MNSFKQIIYWLILGSKGGVNRARIISVLKENPMNANELAKTTRLDYKTVKHHLDLLRKNNVVNEAGGKYGKMFFVSQELLDNVGLFEELFEKKVEKEMKK